MAHRIKELISYRELLAVLAWKNVIVRYKQAYLGLLWTILKPVLMVVVFSVVRSFVGIDTGKIPYAVLTFGALAAMGIFPGIGIGRDQQCGFQCRPDQEDLLPPRDFSAGVRSHQDGRTGYQFRHLGRINDLLSANALNSCGLGTTHHLLHHPCVTLHQHGGGCHERLLP